MVQITGNTAAVVFGVGSLALASLAFAPAAMNTVKGLSADIGNVMADKCGEIANGNITVRQGGIMGKDTTRPAYGIATFDAVEKRAYFNDASFCADVSATLADELRATSTVATINPKSWGVFGL